MPVIQLQRDDRWGALGEGLGNLLGAFITAKQKSQTAQGVAQIDQDENVPPNQKYDAILKQYGPEGITLYNQMLTSQHLASQIAGEKATTDIDVARLPGVKATARKEEVGARTAEATESLATRAALANIAEKEASGQLSSAQAAEARARIPLVGAQVGEVGARAGYTAAQTLLAQQDAVRAWMLENERRINMGQPPQDPSTMPRVGPVTPAGPALGVPAAAPAVPAGVALGVPAPPAAPAVTGGGVPATSDAPAARPATGAPATAAPSVPAAPPAGTAPPDVAHPTPLDLKLDTEGVSDPLMRARARERYNSAEQEKPGSGYTAVDKFLEKYVELKAKPTPEPDKVFAGKVSGLLDDLGEVVRNIEKDPGAGGGLWNAPKAWLQKHNLMGEDAGLMARITASDQLRSSFVQQRGGFGGNWLLSYAESITPGGVQHGPIYSMMGARVMVQKAVDELESRRSGYAPDQVTKPLDDQIVKARKLLDRLDTFWATAPFRPPPVSAAAPGGAALPTAGGAADDALRFQIYKAMGLDPTRQHLYYRGYEIDPKTFKPIGEKAEFPDGAMMRLGNGKAVRGSEVNTYARTQGIDPRVVWGMMQVKSRSEPGQRSTEQPIAPPG